MAEKIKAFWRFSAQVWLGVGMGLILAGLLVIAFPRPAPGKQEIERQARALGMVYRDEVLVLSGKTDQAAAGSKAVPEKSVASDGCTKNQKTEGR